MLTFLLLNGWRDVSSLQLETVIVVGRETLSKALYYERCSCCDDG
jgi:hypothetical protein